MKILIIGSEGYIGSFLNNRYKNLYNIKCIDIKINKFGREITEEEIRENNIIIYLGGLSGRKQCEDKTKEEVYFENVDDILNVIHKMNKNQLIIYASSASLLEGSHDIPVDENYEIKQDLLDKYAESMMLREKAIKNINNTNTIGLRFGTVIGISPNQRVDLVHIAMMKSAIRKGIVNVVNPKCYRSILSIQDLADVFSKIIHNYENIKGNNIYNIGSFNGCIMSFAKNITDYTHSKLNIISDNGLSGFSMDNLKFCKDFNFIFRGNNLLLIKELSNNINYICKNEIEYEYTCRVCKSNKLKTIIDLGFQPLANNYVSEPTIQDQYPLCLVRCIDCNHTQLNYTVKPEIMFKNYQYNSGTSYTLRKYFETLAYKINSEVNTNNKNKIILELACNDGSQLDEFKKLNWITYGVDPAENLVDLGTKNGHKIFCGFWGVDSFNELPDNIDVILAQNVLAHVPDPIMFLKKCYEYMNEKTYLYIQTSQCNMYINGEFDTIYHEHLSFFTIASMMEACKISNLSIIEILKQPIHGTSYLFKIVKMNENNSSHSTQAKIEHLNEKKIGLYNDEFYSNYCKRIQSIKSFVLNEIEKAIKDNYPIIGYGAAAKGMTLINYFDITCLDYIIDDATMKHNKYTPGKNIIIKEPKYLETDNRNLCIIVFAWNFFDEIVENIKKYRKNIDKQLRIISVFPTPKIIYL